MWAKIKEALSSSLVWVAGLLIALALLWHRNEELETEIQVSKEKEKLKDLKNEQKDVDSAAASAEHSYDELLRDYMRSGTQGSGQGDSGPKGPN